MYSWIAFWNASFFAGTGNWKFKDWALVACAGPARLLELAIPWLILALVLSRDPDITAPGMVVIVVFAGALLSAGTGLEAEPGLEPFDLLWRNGISRNS